MKLILTLSLLHHCFGLPIWVSPLPPFGLRLWIIPSINYCIWILPSCHHAVHDSVQVFRGAVWRKKKQSVQTAVQHSNLRPQSWKLLKQSQMDQEANLLLLFVCLFVLKTNPFSESMNCGSMSTAQNTFFSTEQH